MSRFVLTAELNIQPPTNAQIRRVINSVNSQLKGIKSPQIFNANQIKQQSAKASGAIAGTTKAANGLSLALARVKSRFAQRLIDASLFSVVNTAIAGVTGAIGNAIRSSIAFEKELAKVAQVTGRAVSELDGLVDSIGELSTKFGTSSAELIGVARTLSQAGLSAQDVSIALKAVAETDLAPTFENMSKTAEGAIAIFGQFGTGARDLAQQLGEINELAGKFAVESGDLIEAIKRGGAAFKTSGGNLREYLALFTTVRSTTREGAAQISTGLRTIFTRIQRPKTIQYFRELGVELTDATGKFVGGFEAFKRLSDAFGNLEDGDIQLIDVAQQLGGVRQVTRVIPLLKNAAKTQEAYNKAAKGGASIAEQREKALNTLAARLNQVKESTLELGRAIMDSFGPALKGLADFLSAAIQNVTAFIKSIDETFLAIDRLIRGSFDYENIAPDLAKGTSGFLALGAAIGFASTAFLGFSGPMGIAFGAASALIPIFARLVSGTDATANSTRLLTENILSLTAGVGGLLLVAKKAGTLGIISDVIAGGAGGVRAKGKGLTKLFGNLAPTVSGIGERFGATSSFDTSVTQRQPAYQSKKLDRTTRLGNFAVGAGGGFLGAKAAQLVFGRTSKSLKEFDEALKKATDVTSDIADTEALGLQAANLQAQKDIDFAGQGIAAAAGGIASIFLGPVGGALVGALTGFAFEIMAQIPAVQDAFVALRDAVSYLTFGYISSSQEIQLVAKTTALAQQSMAKTKKFVEDFNNALDDDKKKRRENEDSSAITSQEIADIANEQLKTLESDIVRLQDNKDKILDKDGDGVRERILGDTYSPTKLSKEEEEAIKETNVALNDKRKALTEAFQKIATETIANGGTFQDAFSKLSPELQRAIKELDIKGQLDQLFDDDSEFRKSVINNLEKTYIDALTQKIKLENQLATATISYLKIQDEAAQIIAEFGGAAYGAREKEANLLKQANAGTGGEFDLVESLTKLSPQQLLKRAEESGSKLAETRRKLSFQDAPGEKTGEQKRLEAQEKELIRLSKQTYDISKKLIDVRKQELNIIKARNEEERAGLEDALKGDFTKLFNAQAAQGVIASVASGGGVDGFSQTAIADAINNLRSQQEAGATEAFGQNITSLIERVAAGGLANVGLSGANAQVLAGTTPEEEQLKKEIRELAAVLPAAARSEMQAAELQIQAARDQLRAAGQRLETAGGDTQDVKDKKFAGNFASGGAIWRKRGTDSVPAMLTPGEFVVRRSAVQRGNNLNMLRAMNQGGSPKSVGGTVYASGGGLNTASGDGLDFSMLNRAADAMTKVSNAMTQMVEKLGQLKLNVTLAPTSHTVNITGTAALQNMGEQIQENVIRLVGEKLRNSKVGSGGNVQEDIGGSNLPSLA
jgi:TP901 family phage tail tape measure protein